jgi:uncharacterized protein involved in exopolysaccharide biosynthesis
MTTELDQNLPVAQDDDISLLDMAIVLAKHKTLVMGFPAIVAVLAVIVSLLMTPQYTATTKILAPEKAQGAANMLAQVSGLAAVAGGAVGLRNPNDLYVGMLKSRTVQDAMLKRFDLQKQWEIEVPSKARKRLEEETTVTASKDSIITVEVSDKDPKQAAEMANAYIDELYKLTKSIATTEAGRRRLFFEAQMLQAKENLSKSEIAAKGGLDIGGLVKVDEQGRTMVEAAARLRGQIAVKEVQIGAMRSYAAEGNPEMRMALQEREVLKDELAKSEGAAAGKLVPGASSGQGLQNLALLREIKYYETVYELLARQYELAKIDEAKDAAIIQILDAAIPPDRKSKPKRVLIVSLATLAAGLLGILLAFVKESFIKAANNESQRDRLEMFRRFWKAPLFQR